MLFRSNILFEEPLFSEARKAASVVDRVADELGCFSSQVALAWLLRTPGVTAPIVGVSRWQQWEANLGALDVDLTDEQYGDISAAGMAVWEMLPEDPVMWGYRPQ